MTFGEKINHAIKNKWLEDFYKIYRRTYYQHFGNYDGCLSYREWLGIRIDLYKPT